MSDGRTRRTALVTGASAGIGQAFAEVFAANGFDLVAVARREDRLRALAADVERRFGTRTHVIVEDLVDRAAPERLCLRIARDGIVVDALVNNAGFGVKGSFSKTDWREQGDLLQILVVAVAEVTHRLLPGMMERGYGRVVNVASLAGLLPGPPGHTLYAAAKSFVIRFSESLAAEVHDRGVHVTAVCPGFTFSEFHDVNQTRDIVSRLPGFMWLDAPTVAQQGYDAVMAGKVVHVTGRVNTAIATFSRLLPYRAAYALNRRASSRYRER
jgi:short-subunit dehydrogenase